MVTAPRKFFHRPKSARMMKSVCRMIPQDTSAHDQKYRPLRRLNIMKSEMLISSPMYQATPAKAAMVMDMGRSSRMSSMAMC